MSSKIITCRKCCSVLKEDVNWSHYRYEKSDYVCDPCYKEYQKQYHLNKQEKRKKQSAEYYKQNKERLLKQQKYSTIKRKYGLSKEQYEEVMKDAVCEICGDEKKLCIDHDHDTGKVRGVLCRTCNMGIGLLGDKYQQVLQAAKYLEESDEWLTCILDK